jgi:hypothetical protein
VNAIFSKRGESSAGHWHSACAVLVSVCLAIPVLGSSASATSTAADPKSQPLGVADLDSDQHCDDNSAATQNDTNDGSAQDSAKHLARTADRDDDSESDDSRAAKAPSQDSDSNDDADSNDDKSADTDQDHSDNDRADAKTQQGDDGSGCSNDVDSADDDSDDDDAVDPDDRPTLESHFDYYTDSSHYVNVTTSSIATAPFQGFMVRLERDWLQARDPNGPQAAEITTLGFNRELTEFWGIGGGFGTARGMQHSDLVGSFQSHFNFHGFSVTATIAREMLLESAQTVKANIRHTDFGLSLSDDLSEHVSADAEVHHQIYSDGNSSNNIAFSPDYTFNLSLGKLALGYRFSYEAFAQNPENGYWAPQKALSDGLSAVWSFDRTEFYGRTELGLGYDSVREIGKLSNGPSSGPDASAAVAFGIRLIKGTELETYWTGNGSPGWNSMNFGISLKYLF